MRAASFITIEGPNGVGKSTLVRRLCPVLRRAGVKIDPTMEPSPTPLGESLRLAERFCRGRALACLAAADRYHHLELIVEPALRSGNVVISDRYVESSLVLQQLDGVDIEFIWSLNSAVMRPLLSVCLLAEPAALAARLDKRGRRSRFELEALDPTRECELYAQTGAFLRERGYNWVAVETTAMSEVAVCEHVVALVKSELEASRG